MTIIYLILAMFLGVIGSGIPNGTGSSTGTYGHASRNTQRRNDLSRFVTAVLDYQANNNGKLPFDNSSSVSIFAERYIDFDCKNSDATQSNNTCGESFQDPDGSPYYFVLNKEPRPESSPLDASFDHGIYVYTYAGCGAEEGTVKRIEQKTQFAFLYVLEGDSIACVDNQ